jgi:hypothetical protein
MKILLICHDFEPMTSPRALRWSALAHQWAKDKHSVDIISAKHGEGKTRTFNKNCTLYPVGPKHRMRRRYASQAAKINIHEDKKFVTSLWTIARRIYQKTWRQYYWPDSACRWYNPALRKALRLIRKNKYDAVITVSHPMTSHRIGLTIKNYYPNLPWLIDIGDPFSFLETPAVNNHSRYAVRNKLLESHVLDKADSIVVTNTNCKLVYLKHFPKVDRNKVHVIPPLLSLKDILSTKPPRLNATVKWVFIGTLYRDIRNPLFLLRLFSAVQDAEQQLHCYGQANDCHAYFTEFMDQHHSQVLLHGSCPREKVSELLSGADILVNIGNKTNFQCPSKIVEYISSGKPILHISNCESDASLEYLANYPSLLVLKNNNDVPTTHQIEQLSAFLNHLPRKLENETIHNLISPFKIDNIGLEYQQLIDTISSEA